MGVVIRRWVWLECIGVVNGCCCKDVYRFPHITFSYSTCISSFLQQHPYFFVHFLKVFSFFKITLYVMTGISLCNDRNKLM